MTINSFFSNPQNFSLTASGVAAQDLSPDSLYQLIQALEMPRSPLVDRYGKINIETGLAVLRARAHNLQHRESGHEDLIERINAIEGAIMPVKQLLFCKFPNFHLHFLQFLANEALSPKGILSLN